MTAEYATACDIHRVLGQSLPKVRDCSCGSMCCFRLILPTSVCRSTDSLASLRNLLDEATFYDKQWDAQWQKGNRPKEQD